MLTTSIGTGYMTGGGIGVITVIFTLITSSAGTAAIRPGTNSAGITAGTGGVGMGSPITNVGIGTGQENYANKGQKKENDR